MKRGLIEREMSMELVVGAFMVMIFLGLGYFTIILSRETWFGTKYYQEVVFKDVMGLREGDNVVVRGMPVGKVTDLALRKTGVHVTVSLDVPLSIRDDYRVQIISTSILGGRYLQIYEGSPDAHMLPPGVVLRGRDTYDLMADASEMVHAVKEGLVEGGMVSNLTVAAAQMREMSERVNAGEGTLGKLMSPDDTLYADLRVAVSNLSVLSSRLVSGEGTMGRLLSDDDRLYRDLSGSVSNLNVISSRLAAGEGTLGRLLSSDDELYEDLSAAVASIRNIVSRIENGEGLLGRLVKDDGLYEKIEETVREMGALVDDYRETAPIVTFTSVFFGAF